MRIYIVQVDNEPVSVTEDLDQARLCMARCRKQGENPVLVTLWEGAPSRLYGYRGPVVSVEPEAQ